MFYIFFYFFFQSPQAFAFNSMPEYSYAGEAERSEINGPSTIGSEFQSDVLAFSKPMVFHYNFLRARRAFDLTTGSLGTKRFLTDNRIKISDYLLSDLEFKLIYLDQADFEKELRAMIYEFTYHFKNWAVALYGETFTHKSRDDLGGALIWKWSQNHQWRFFITAVDFSYNERNQTADFYSQQPYAYGFVGRWFGEKDQQQFIEYSLLWEPLSQRERIDRNQQNSYRQKSIHIRSRTNWDIEEKSWINIDLSVSEKFEAEKNTLATAPVDDQAWETSSMDFLVQYERDSIIYGLKTTYRYWNSDGGSVTHNDLLPHFWYKWVPQEYNEMKTQWSIGYEFTWHRGQGDEKLRSTLDNNNKLEHRLNIRYDLLFSHLTRLYFHFTFDLDEFATHETWEGGNIQFQWIF